MAEKSDKKKIKKTRKSRAETPETQEKKDKIREMQDQRQHDRRVLDEIWGVTFLAIGIFLIVTTQLDTTGEFGKAIHDILLGLFGVMAYVLPYYFIVIAFCLFFQKMQHINGRTTFFSIMTYLMMCLLNSYRFLDAGNLQYGWEAIKEYYWNGVSGQYGGVIGMELGTLVVKLIGKPGLLIAALAVIVISLLLIINTPISASLSRLWERHEERVLLREMEEEEEDLRSHKVQDTVLANEDRLLNAKPPRTIEPEPEEHGIGAWLKSIRKNSMPESEQTSDMDTTILPSEYSSVGIDDDAIGAPAYADLMTEPFAPEMDSSHESLRDQQVKANILEIMSQDDIGGSVPDDADTVRSAAGQTGMGLGSPEPRSAGFGLDGNGTNRRQGFGLDGYADPTSRAANAAGLAAAAGSLSAKDLCAKEQKKANTPTAEDHAEVLKQVEAGSEKLAQPKDYFFPPIDLLKKPSTSQLQLPEDMLRRKAELLEKTLRNFHVDARVLNVTQGSSVTRYEVQPAIGVKVSSITKLADDIALNMRAKSIRIEAPIPGKPAIGIEVENDKPSPVLVRELIDSDEFRKAVSKISFIVGKDISGNNIIANLKDMPHLLIAGATGSGKSVCINAIITSLLYKASPDEVRLILIDPKVVELGNYNGIPHMLIPVVTDPKKAAAALNWAVGEMNRRYKLFAEESVKAIDAYNELMVANQEPENVLPKIIIIIDELADLMMASPAQVEESICRLAQLARAAGMHLIVATQRPSVDIVTGLIKANIPSRIAFSVSSQFDSRTILDVNGAEKLLGKGDMLFSPVGSNKPIRIQGPYISDTEISRVIRFVKDQAESDYDEQVIESVEMTNSAGHKAAGDELTEDAIAFILQSKKASVSMLQRRFRIGYNRAASIIDEIEARGIITPADGSKPRRVLYTEDEYYQSQQENTNGDDQSTNE